MTQWASLAPGEWRLSYYEPWAEICAEVIVLEIGIDAYAPACRPNMHLHLGAEFSVKIPVPGAANDTMCLQLANTLRRP